MSSAKWKEFYGKSDKINELILKTKANLKERPDNSHPWIMVFLLVDWLSFGEGEGGGEGFV